MLRENYQDSTSKSILHRHKYGSGTTLFASKELFSRLWSETLEILRDGKIVEINDSVIDDIERISYIDLINEKTVEQFHEQQISYGEEHRFAFWSILLLKQLLANLSVRLSRATEIYGGHYNMRDFREFRPLNFHIGLLCKETEQIKFPVTKSLKLLADLLEDTDFKPNESDLINTLGSVIYSVWNGGNDNDIDIQVFYADLLYDAIVPTCELMNIPLDKKWLSAYTWLYGDKDGRPFEKNSDTEELIVTLRKRITERYAQDLDIISTHKGFSAFEDIDLIKNKLKSIPVTYRNAEEFISDLAAIKIKNTSNHLVDTLIMKVRTFGFHYLEIEFRDNEEILSSVVDTIIPGYVINLKYPALLNYSELSEDEKIDLLCYLMEESEDFTPVKLKNLYTERTELEYQKRKKEYTAVSYIELIDSDPEYIKMYDARNIMERFTLMSRFPDMMKTHGIAEARYLSSVFELIFLSKTESNLDNINIAIQPEDSHGAIETLGKIKKLYSNDLYRKHLSSLDNTQFITFGPSDTGKQGGKGMHKLNMSLAREHEVIAQSFGIKLVRHVITGGEHARCNGNFKEIFNEYGASRDVQTRFMLAGCAEMRTHLLSNRQAVNFFCDVYDMHLQKAPLEDFSSLKNSQKVWSKVVERYQSNFFETPAVTMFLKKISRFDIVRGTAKGTRPPTRLYNITEFESRPDAIRAIPWTRSILLTGIHSELLGAGVFELLSAEQVFQRAQTDIKFVSYIKHIAYALSRTDEELMWQTSGWSRPNNDTIKRLAQDYERSDKTSLYQLLCWISHEVILAKELVWNSMHGYSHPTPEYLSAEDLLSDKALLEEVNWKEYMLTPYKLMLINTKKDVTFLSSAALQNFYSGFLELANTDHSLIYAIEE